MAPIVIIHSFRRGTGKTSATANLAALSAAQGKRVGIIDTDIASPAMHLLFDMEEEDIVYTLNDYLWGKCGIEDAVHEVTDRLKAPISGKIFLIPSSSKVGEAARLMREGFDMALLTDGFQDLLEAFKLDTLFVDTHSGLNEETLLLIAVSDVLVIVVRPDKQDYQYTSVSVDVARKLEVPNVKILVNNAPKALDTAALQKQLEEIYSANVAAIIPYSENMMALASSGVFSLQFPDDKVARLYEQALYNLRL